MNHTQPPAEPILVPGGYMSPELHDGKYLVWFGYVLHDNNTTEYIGAHNHRRTIASAIYDTYRKGPLEEPHDATH